MKVKIIRYSKTEKKNILLIEDMLASNPIQLFPVAQSSMTHLYPVCPGCHNQSPLSKGNKKQKNEPQCSLYGDLLPDFIFKFLCTRRWHIEKKKNNTLG